MYWPAYTYWNILSDKNTFEHFNEVPKMESRFNKGIGGNVMSDFDIKDKLNKYSGIKKFLIIISLLAVITLIIGSLAIFVSGDFDKIFSGKVINQLK